MEMMERLVLLAMLVLLATTVNLAVVVRRETQDILVNLERMENLVLLGLLELLVHLELLGQSRDQLELQEALVIKVDLVTKVDKDRGAILEFQVQLGLEEEEAPLVRMDNLDQ